MTANKVLFIGSLHQHLHINLLSIIAKIVSTSLTNKNSTCSPGVVTKELIMKILFIHHTPYCHVVCHRAVDFRPWSEGTDRGGEHQCLFHTACPRTCTSIILLARPRCISNQLHCSEKTFMIVFHQQLPQMYLPLLIYPPSWLVAKSSRKKRRSSTTF